MTKIDSIQKYLCKSCGSVLTSNDWPYFYKSIGCLCDSCKNKAKFILKNY